MIRPITRRRALQAALAMRHIGSFRSAFIAEAQDKTPVHPAKAEPFDFLTWFEFAKADTAAFDKLLSRLRASEEWQYVEHEVEIRFEHDHLAAAT